MSMSPFYRKMRVKETAHVEKLATRTITTDTTLQPEDSGKVIFMGKTGVDITLPDPPFDGFNVKIILNEDNATTACTVTCNGTGEFFAGSIGSATHDTGVDSAIFNGSSNDVCTFHATLAEAGDWIEIVSNGSLWFICGQSSVVGGIVASDS